MRQHNKLVARRSEDRKMEIHKRKLYEMKSSGASSSPTRYHHVFAKQKLNFMIEGRLLKLWLLCRKKPRNHARKHLITQQNAACSASETFSDDEPNLNPNLIQSLAASSTILETTTVSEFRGKGENLA